MNITDYIPMENRSDDSFEQYRWLPEPFGPELSGNGPPEGVVVGLINQRYRDLITNLLYIKLKEPAGSQVFGWRKVGLAVDESIAFTDDGFDPVLGAPFPQVNYSANAYNTTTGRVTWTVPTVILNSVLYSGVGKELDIYFSDTVKPSNTVFSVFGSSTFFGAVGTISGLITNGNTYVPPAANGFILLCQATAGPNTALMLNTAGHNWSTSFGTAIFGTVKPFPTAFGFAFTATSGLPNAAWPFTFYVVQTSLDTLLSASSQLLNGTITFP